VKKIVEEKVFNNRRADIYLELENKKRIVIEIQHSPMSSSELLDRTSDYTKQNLHVLWIFNGSSFSRYPYIYHGGQISSLEKILNQLYYGRVYYINALKEGIATSIYPLYFAQYQERKRYRSGFEYYRYSKNKRSLIPGEMPSLTLLPFTHNKLKLARFMDENVKTVCIKDVKRFLEEYQLVLPDHEINDMGLNEFEKLIFVLMSKFETKYGLHLLYTVLKQLKVIENNEFFYLHSISQYHQNKILSV